MTVRVKIPDSPLLKFDVNSDVLKGCLIDIANKQALLNDELAKVHRRCNELEKSLESKNEPNEQIAALLELPKTVEKLENMVVKLQASQDKLDAKQHESVDTMNGMQVAIDEEKARGNRFLNDIAKLEKGLGEKISKTEKTLTDCVRVAEAAQAAAKKISATEAVIRNLESNQTKVTNHQVEMDDNLKGMTNSVETNRVGVEHLREGAQKRVKELAVLSAALNDLSLTKAERGTVEALSTTIDCTLGAVRKNLSHIAEIELPLVEHQMREEIRAEAQLMCERCDCNYRSVLAEMDKRQPKSAGTMKCLLCKEVRNDKDDGFVEGSDGKWYPDPRTHTASVASARHALESPAGDAPAISGYRAKQMGAKSRFPRVMSHPNKAGALKGHQTRPSTAPQYRSTYALVSRSTPVPAVAPSTPLLGKLGWKSVADIPGIPVMEYVMDAISNDKKSDVSHEVPSL